MCNSRDAWSHRASNPSTRQKRSRRRKGRSLPQPLEGVFISTVSQRPLHVTLAFGQATHSCLLPMSPEQFDVGMQHTVPVSLCYPWQMTPSHQHKHFVLHFSVVAAYSQCPLPRSLLLAKVALNSLQPSFGYCSACLRLTPFWLQLWVVSTHAPGHDDLEYTEHGAFRPDPKQTDIDSCDAFANLHRDTSVHMYRVSPAWNDAPSLSRSRRQTTPSSGHSCSIGEA